ncbi:hypothetical protein PCANC_27766 [Puccinia coronata f. sp. avenae]|uniref:Uncharacterized protein n=1 Tax=Puccinia coronata f. sp. avenae TaxID=200324 RepID=A0A2N5RZ60_9BASI|nr:hypothetical protein PCANC_27766 [Puccinia coronata f. sp. avenae]
MDANNNNGFLIWTRIKDLFAQRTGLCLSQCLTQWHKIQYKGSLTNYLDQVEAFLATFDSISYVQEGSAICGVITSTLSESQGSLTNPILTNNDLMLDPVLLLTKIWDIAFNEGTCNRPAAPEHSATAMATNSKTCSQATLNSLARQHSSTPPHHSCCLPFAPSPSVLGAALLVFWATIPTIPSKLKEWLALVSQRPASCSV